MFRNWTPSTPWTGGYTHLRPTARLQAVAERVGVQGATFQALRRTVATIMEASCSDAMITRQMRHTSLETAKRFYRKADISSMKASMDGFAY